MKGRFEVSPGIGISVRDAFFTKITPQLALTYHFTETIGLSLRGGYNVSLISGAAQICVPDATVMRRAACPPTIAELTTRLDANRGHVAYGRMACWRASICSGRRSTGKISLSAEKVLNFNMYGLIGPAFMMYGPNNALTVGGNVGIGFRFFINQWLTVRLELRDVIYYENGLQPATRSATS